MFFVVIFNVNLGENIFNVILTESYFRNFCEFDLFFSS